MAETEGVGKKEIKREKNDFCWLGRRGLRRWISCFNELVFLIEIEKNKIIKPVLVHGKAITHPQRQNLLRRFNNYLYNLFLRVSRDNQLNWGLPTLPLHKDAELKDDDQLKRLGDLVDDILKNIYLISSNVGGENIKLDLVDLLKRATELGSQLELATVNEIVTAYHQHLIEELASSGDRKKLSLSFSVGVRRRGKAAEIAKINEIPRLNDVDQVLDLEKKVLSASQEFFGQQIKWPKDNSKKAIISKELNKILTDVVTATFGNLLIFPPKEVNLDDIIKQVSKRTIDDLTWNISRDGGNKIGDKGWLLLRSNLKSHPLDLEVDFQSYLKKRGGGWQANFGHLTNVARRVSNRLSAGQLSPDMISSFIRRRLDDIDLNPEDRPKVAQEITNYLLYVRPYLSPAEGDRLLKKILLTNNLSTATIGDLKRTIGITQNIFSIKEKHLNRLEKWLLTRKKVLETVLGEGVDPEIILKGLFNSADDLRRQLDWLEKGGPIKIGRLVVTSRPRLEKDDPRHQRLEEAIDELERAHDVLRKIKLPLPVRIYSRLSQVRATLSGRKDRLFESVNDVWKYQLTIGASYLLERIEKKKIIQEIINGERYPFINKLFGGVHYLYEEHKREDSRRSKAVRIAKKIYFASHLDKNKTVRSVIDGSREFGRSVTGWLKERKAVKWFTGAVDFVKEKIKTIAEYWQKFQDKLSKLKEFPFFKGLWLISHPRQLFKKGLIWGAKKVGQLAIKLLSKIGVDIGGLVSGVGSVIAIALIIKDVFSIFRRYWKEILAFIGGLLYFLIQFILSHILAFLGALIGGLLFGPVGAVIGFTAGLFIGSLSKLISSAIASASSFAASVGATVAGLATSSSATALLLTAVPGGSVLALTVFFIYPQISASFLKKGYYYRTAGTPYLKLYKTLDMSKVSSKYILKDNTSSLPHLDNSAARNRITLTYSLQLQAVDRNLKIVQAKDSLEIDHKNGKKDEIKQDVDFLKKEIKKNQGIKTIEVTVLRPEYKNSRLTNTLEVTAIDDKGRQYHKITGFIVLIGNAPGVSCQQLALTASQLADQLYRCHDGIPPQTVSDCFCPQNDNSSMGYFRNTYHCGQTLPLGPFSNYINPGSSELGHEEHYIQCTEFVNDVYRQAYGRSLYNLCGGQVLGNAGDWLRNSNLCGQFLVPIQNGSGDPSPGDVLVFQGGATGHVAVVTSINGNTLSFVNANMMERLITISKTEEGIWQSPFTSMRLVGWLHNQTCHP